MPAQLPTAGQITSKMKIGWNLGNILEATWVPRNSFGTTTQATIDSVKAAGFNTVRLPVAWYYHSNVNTSVIDTAWLRNVKKVVDFCMKDSMYVIINAHWDTGWLENHVTVADSASVNPRQRAYWTQIANYFKEYNEHLLLPEQMNPMFQMLPVCLSFCRTINPLLIPFGQQGGITVHVRWLFRDRQLISKLPVN